MEIPRDPSIENRSPIFSLSSHFLRRFQRNRESIFSRFSHEGGGPADFGQNRGVRECPRESRDQSGPRPGLLGVLATEGGQGMAGTREGDPTSTTPDEDVVKIIILGDSAAGKSKLVERYLMDDYAPQQLSTYALTLFRHKERLDDGNVVPIDLWDTAGQDRFNSLHPSYYFRAHACILCFDITRKITYKNLEKWYEELRTYCPSIPCMVVGNKIDVDYEVTKKSFAFASKRGLPFMFVSAADGTNVARCFREVVKMGLTYKNNPEDDYYTEVMNLLAEGEVL